MLCVERLSAVITQKVNHNHWVGLKASCDGTVLLSLIFSLQMISSFFGKATSSQCEVIKDTLNMFCEESGQLVSSVKSKKFVSPNVSNRVAKDLSTLCGFTLTKDLWYASWGPFNSFNKVSIRHYQYIIETLEKKLAGWKSDSLNLTGRSTMVQSVTSTTPNYTMQTVALPTPIINQIDKINRNFLWGDTSNKKRIHLINWDTVCCPKHCGGLGIRKAGATNLALLAKLGWRIMTERQPLWIHHHF